MVFDAKKKSILHVEIAKKNLFVKRCEIIDFENDPFTNPCTLAEQFQKFLSLQPQALSVSSFICQLPHNSSGMSFFEWILDSGASHHMSLDSSSFTSVCSSFSIYVMTAVRTAMHLSGVDSVITLHLPLVDVYRIPKLTLNLVFVGQLCDSGYLVMFSNSSCNV